MVSATPLSPTPRSTVRRGAKRARTDRGDLYAVLDAGLVGHLAVVLDGAPVVLPTGYGRSDDTLYLHGSTGAGTLRAATAGAPVCFTVTHLDGVVYARSAFHHSLNYRCAVVHGTARPVTDPDEKLLGLQVLTEQLAPGSWTATRQPDRKELAATAVLALDLAEASVKIRTGPPGDDEADLAAPGDSDPVWAGVLPFRTVSGTPEPCPLLPVGVPVPGRVRNRALSPPA
ncbi:pyridoxamine 5'-phosphate oxidase family protein [Blastococcus goldschmidtiae]|uniref:Pyridoxamine 5'-phosphate oxidase family protein n=1 Tax=Blastococcus goldschmidtiae TaxID=3075546 RepID=A0ABU2K405_9ACTN|nr:pyridoxamine 5'-phosphate oxidase family protein [Blastococcus sp. DSM 46792]MDT0274895.1 pyridoxamine 5'-phosphate oxidase family protein [Blastococcus sp. DSM 46792]